MCGSDAPFKSKWTMVFRFNAILYTIMSALLVCSCGGLVYVGIMATALTCINCTGAAHLAAIIVTGIMRLNSTGSTCALNETAYNEAGDSWSSDGSTLKALFIAQCSLLIPFGCCTCFSLCFGTLGGAMKANRSGASDDDFQRIER